MAKYIIGYTSREYLIGAYLLPKKNYNEEEKTRGKKAVLTVTEEDLKILQTNPIFKGLLEQKKVRILDQEPAWAQSGEAREAGYKARIAELEAKGSSKKVKDLESAVDKLETEKTQIIDEAQKRITDLEAELAALKK